MYKNFAQIILLLQEMYKNFAQIILLLQEMYKNFNSFVPKVKNFAQKCYLFT